ncbi:limonene-1,2-epoxide hydrolase family protein [Rhizobium sp. Leaf306]|uniref:limonene-1,2-epoxide hydrolase family protein n=1 Tax=Rhizobium sp. Leaf306 TaxID=1736330 RepID=UPI001FCD8F38|nr:limonene-1,2-epoxide hydrolase family protein [Rhizobium sp. Leaf306]
MANSSASKLRHGPRRWVTSALKAINFLDRPERSPSIAAVHFDMQAIAADGNRVLTERLTSLFVPTAAKSRRARIDVSDGRCRSEC